MKLLFVNPSLRLNHPYKLLPVGLGMVMTYTEMNGYEFDFLDIDINDMENDEVEKYIENNHYDIIAFGTIVTHYKWIKWFCNKIKFYQPDTKIIVGNSVSGSCIDVFMKNIPADFAVIGEGEITFLELLDALRKNKDVCDIEGIAYRNGDGYKVNGKRKALKRVDEFPHVNWDYFDVEKYRSKKTSMIDDEDENDMSFPVNTARGCAFQCSFCHYVFWDDPYRHRSPDSIIDEIERNIEKYGTTTIGFWDELSFAGLNQVEALSKRIIERKVEFRWSCATRTDLFGRPDRSRAKREYIAKLMKDAGCYSTGFSLESANKEILKMMNKKVDKECFSEHITILKNAGIKTYTSIVFGYPIETKETIKETFDMCEQNHMYPSIGYLLPLPYTEMYEYAKKNGFITDEDAYLDSITERQNLCLNMTQMSNEEIINEIKIGAQRLNISLDLKFDKTKLIKTGGYKKVDDAGGMGGDIEKPEIIRNENDFSFNYSKVTFDTATNPKK